jgi:hypothetical protein
MVMSSLTGAHDAFRSALGAFELAQAGDARVTDLVAPATLYESVEDAAMRVIQTPAQDLEDVMIKFDVLSAWYLADVWLDHRLDDRAARAYRIATLELGEFASCMRCRRCGRIVSS